MEDPESTNLSLAGQAAVGVKRLGAALVNSVTPDEAGRAFKLDAYAGVLAGLYTGAVYPFLGKIARDNLHADVFLISLMAAAPCIGPLLAPFWARQMSGKGKMPFAVGSWVIGRALLILMALVAHAWAFVIIVSLVQIVCSVSTPAYSTLMKEIYPDRIRGHCMGMVRVGIQISTFVVALVAGRLLDMDVFAFHWVFPVAAVIGVVSALIFGRIKAEPIDADSDYKPRIQDSFLLLKQNPQYRWFAISVFIFGIGNLIAVPAMILHQVDNLHIRNENISYLVNVSAMTAIPAYFIWGRLLDRRGPLYTVWSSMLLVAIVPLVYIFANDWRLLIIAAIASGAANPGVELSYLNSILKFSEDHNIPQYQSIHTFLFGVRGTIAPFIGAALIKGSAVIGVWLGVHPKAGGSFLAPVFVISMCLIITGAWMQVIGLRKRYRALDQGA